MSITDRLRWTVIEANTNKILTRDLVVKEAEPTINLSAPSSFHIKVDQSERYKSARDIVWGSYKHVIVCEIECNHVQTVFGFGIVDDAFVDPQTGELNLEVTGPLGYPKEIPWLENFNPIAVDPFEVIQRVMAHVQSYVNANLGIEVVPASSGTQMLPGYGFDGNILSFDFWAMFIRATDFVDCGDQITSLARDIPFDMFEEASWNANRTTLNKQIRLAYPLGGFDQTHLRFVVGENVIAAEKAEEMDIEPVSDVIVRSWIPGRVYSSRLSNSDTTRYRRVKLEEDVFLDSTERAAVYAKRKLQKRNVPVHFKSIVVNPNHINAPFPAYGLGDTIRVQAEDYPWTGPIDQRHRITSITYKENEAQMVLGLKAEGAFNYDPIDYDPDYGDQPVVDANRLSNGYFADNLKGWISRRGQWIRVATQTYDDTFTPNAGSVRIDCDDNGERFESHKATVAPGEHITLCAAVRWYTLSSGANDSISLIAHTSNNGVAVSDFTVQSFANPSGVHGWTLLKMNDWLVPPGVNEVSLEFNVSAGVHGGYALWTFARVYTMGQDGPVTS